MCPNVPKAREAAGGAGSSGSQSQAQGRERPLAGGRVTNNLAGGTETGLNQAPKKPGLASLRQLPEELKAKERPSLTEAKNCKCSLNVQQQQSRARCTMSAAVGAPGWRRHHSCWNPLC